MSSNPYQSSDAEQAPTKRSSIGCFLVVGGLIALSVLMMLVLFGLQPVASAPIAKPPVAPVVQPPVNAPANPN